MLSCSRGDSDAAGCTRRRGVTITSGSPQTRKAPTHVCSVRAISCYQSSFYISTGVNLSLCYNSTGEEFFAFPSFVASRFGSAGFESPARWYVTLSWMSDSSKYAYLVQVSAGCRIYQNTHAYASSRSWMSDSLKYANLCVSHSWMWGSSKYANIGVSLLDVKFLKKKNWGSFALLAQRLGKQ